MPLPEVAVELYYDDTWHDITTDVRTRQDIEVSRGRSDESSQAEPSSCSMQINNKDGRYSTHNPTSPLYGRIGRNTPIRMRRGPAGTVLLLRGKPDSVAYTEADTELNVATDLDLRVEITPQSWRPEGFTIVASKGSSSDLSWGLRILPGGHPELTWSPDGSTRNPVGATEPVPEDAGRLAVRVTLDVDNGAGGYVLTYYTADTIDGPWTQLGDAIVGGSTTQINDNGVNVTLGAMASGGRLFLNGATFHGLFHAFQLLDGIDGPTLADVDISTASPGGRSFTGTQGLEWLVFDTAKLTDRSVRFTGEVSAWPQRWHVSGGDVWTPIEAAGISRRLGQGASALQSALYRGMTGDNVTQPAAYWPLEDGETATSFASAFGAAPVRPKGDVRPAQYADAPASEPIPVVNTGGYLPALVPQYPQSDIVRGMLYVNVPDPPTADGTVLLLRLYGGSLLTFLATTTTDGSITVSVYDNGSPDQGPQLVHQNTITFGISGQEGLVWLLLQQNGPDIDWQVGFAALNQDGGEIYEDTLAGHQFGRVRAVESGTDDQLDQHAIGHMMLLTTLDFWAIADFARGWQGEAAFDRMVRLSGEEGIAFQGYAPDATAPMGPQRVRTYLGLMNEAATVDMGQLTDARDNLALHYRSRSSMYGQTPVVVDYDDLAPPLEPQVDDQATRNDVTVKRVRGSSFRARKGTGDLSVLPPPHGVGIYDQNVEVNADEDDQLADMAGWRLHLGTVDDPRYPTVRVNLTASPHLADVLYGLELGDLLRITNLPPWLPPGDADLIVQGVTETHNEFSWDVELNCTPGGPWTAVGLLGEVRADTDGSTLTASVGETATSLEVTTGIVETFDGPRRLRVIQSDWKVTTSDANSGTHSLRSRNIGADGRTDALFAVPPGAETVEFMYRVSSEASFDHFRFYVGDELQFESSGEQAWGTSAKWDVRNASEITFSYQKDGSVSGGADSAWVDDIRFNLGPTWTTDPDDLPFDVEIGGEIVTVTDVTGAGNPQTFTVARSVNGIVKAHDIGTDVRLAQPSVAAW